MKWRKNIRLKSYDYKTDGYYFITICTALRKPLLKQYRKEAELMLQSLPIRFPGLTVDVYYILDDHIHIIFILENVNVSVNEIVRVYKALVTKTTECKPFWEHNFYEHIIRNENALYEIRKYIQENPQKERFDFKSIYQNFNKKIKDKVNKEKT